MISDNSSSSSGVSRLGSGGRSESKCSIPERHASIDDDDLVTTNEGGSDVEGEIDYDSEDENPDMRIALNIGGQIFETRRYTLTRAPGSMLTAMFGNCRVMAKPDSKSQYFFDRDPTHFRLLLNYLRTGKAILPDSKHQLQELLLEAEYYCIEEMREAIQRALGGLKFEDNFLTFNTSGGIWKEGAIRTYCAVDYKAKNRKTQFDGFPQSLSIIEQDGRNMLRMTSIMSDFTRRAMATTELFSSDTQRAEVLFRVQPKSDPKIPAKYQWNADGIFEFYLWNPGSGEYIGIFLYGGDFGETKNLHIACYEGGQKKEKTVENAWDYDQELRFTLQAAGDKTEVRVIAQKKKTFHVPVSLTRIAPFHVVLGQRTGSPGVECYCDVAVRRVAVFG